MRKPRADGQRNRLRLIAVARNAFAESGPDVALEEIARRAGVGIATFYRNFPTRGAALEAVYRHEVEQLAAAAPRLVETRPALEAMREWMQLFVDYIATKKVIAPALVALVGEPPEVLGASGAWIKSAMAILVANAVDHGAIRSDIEPLDLLRALAGFANVGTDPDWAAGARRLIGILIEGVKSPPPNP